MKIATRIGVMLLALTVATNGAHASLETVDRLLANGEEQQAVTELTRLVDDNQADAQERLGDLYITGRAVPLNFSMAWQWYKRAALQGRASAQYKVGYLYQHGIGVVRYIDKATEWYEFAAKQNYFAAQIALAEMLASGGQMLGGKTLDVLLTAASRGDRVALRNIETFARAGDRPARDALDRLPLETRYGATARLPRTGNSADRGIAAFVAGDYVAAVSTFKPLADNRQPAGLFGMALIFQEGPAIMPDTGRAEAYYLKAAKQGLSAAMTNLGLLYWQTKAPPNDVALARKWLGLAIKGGSSRAAGALTLIDQGTMTQEAARDLRRAAATPGERAKDVSAMTAYRQGHFDDAMVGFKHLSDGGDSMGDVGLGIIYDQGVPALGNPDLSRSAYQDAAGQGFAPAQVNLANLYWHGIDVAENVTLALDWYGKAAGQGDALAQTMSAYGLLSGSVAAADRAAALDLFQQASRQENDDAATAVALLQIGALPITSGSDRQNPLQLTIRSGYATGRTVVYAEFALPTNVDATLLARGIAALAGPAGRGNAAAQYNMAMLYLRMPPATANDLDAYRWLTLAYHNGNAGALAARNAVVGRLSKSQRVEAEWLVAASVVPRTMVPPVDLIEAIAGSAEEQWQYGLKYRYGRGVEKNYREAFRWFQSAALKGHATAQRDLGTLYRRGLGVQRDFTQAAKWFRQSARQGNMKAERDLGILHQFGRGVPQDDAEAVRWYRKAADQGERKAQTNLAFMYKAGRGVSQDFQEAARWYRKAADQGSAVAQKNLGVFYQFGHGVGKDPAAAVKWYQLAAEQGNVKAQEDLGFMFKNGVGVDVDYERAARWYYEAAKKESPRAQNVLGLMYQSGNGLRQDFGKAAGWYIKAFKQGYKKSYVSIESLVRTGPLAAPELTELAVELRKRAERGDVRSQNILGLAYQFGTGVKKDRTMAEKWFNEAIGKGSAEAKKNLTEMRMKPS